MHLFDIVVELGLQSINDETLRFLNRGHTVEDFDKAFKMLKQYGIEICVHYINDLPIDKKDDILIAAKMRKHIKVKCAKF